MAFCSRLLVVIAALLLSGAAWAQGSKGWIGVEVRDVTKAEADRLGWDAPRGAIIARAPEPGTPAHKAGLKAGDIILAVERTLIDTSSEFHAAVETKSPGSELRLQVLSGGRERRVPVTLAELPGRTIAVGGVPQLLLDSGGHMALIRGLAFTPDGKHLISAGDDKAVRVWDWQTGKTIRTIRGQVGPGEVGKLFAMALSPNGRWLATAGWTHQECGTRCGEIRLYDFNTGRLEALLAAHTNVVDALAFSPDSRLLLSGSKDQTAIIWDIESRRAAQRLRGHGAEIYAVAFAPGEPRALTLSDDAKLRVWQVNNGKLLGELSEHTDRARGLAASRSGRLVATAAKDGRILLWDVQNLRLIKELARRNEWIGRMAFSGDETMLVTTCEQNCGDGYIQRVWDIASGQEKVIYRDHNSIVLAAAMSPTEGRLAATAGGERLQINVWDIDTGKTRRTLAGTGAVNWGTGFSSDGRNIAWGNTWKIHTSRAANPLEYQLRLAVGNERIGRPEPVRPDAAAAFVRARTTHGGYALAHRKGGAYGYDAVLELKKDGQLQASIERGVPDGYSHRAYTFTPDGQTIISGGANGWISAYDLSGKRLGDFIGHESEIWAVTPSPDGRLLVSGSNDHTIRLWNLKTRELIVTLFRGSDGEWVMWTPQGYYTGSPGSDKIVGWQINRGPEHAAEYVGADQLRTHLHRPDIVEKAIVLASAEQAVREAPGTVYKLADLLAKPVPRFKIESPQPGSTHSRGRVGVRITVQETPDHIKAIRVQVNGRQVEELIPPTGSGGFTAGEYALNVPLGRGRNEIRVTLTNAIGDKAETLTLEHDGDGDLDKRGTLYILAIGVDEYKGLGNSCGYNGRQTCDLRYSGADARLLVDAIERRLGPSHTNVVKRVLVNRAADPTDLPTAANILDAVGQLGQATEIDTVIVSIAGHGVNDGANYRFLPTNAEWSGTALRGSTVVSWNVLQEAVESAKGRRLLFVDTCHSGNAYNQRLGNAAYHANIVAYTAARFDQLANESHKLGHGIFTYSVVEALTARRQVSTKDLAEYIVKRVGELAKEIPAEQEPQYFRGRDAEDYILVR